MPFYSIGRRSNRAPLSLNFVSFFFQPTVYVAESSLSSGSAGKSSEGSSNVLAISVGLGLIAIAGAAVVLVNVGKNPPGPAPTYSGPPLSYYIQKFKPEVSVEAEAGAPDVVDVETAGGPADVATSGPEEPATAEEDETAASSRTIEELPDALTETTVEEPASSEDVSSSETAETSADERGTAPEARATAEEEVATPETEEPQVESVAGSETAKDEPATVEEGVGSTETAEKQADKAVVAEDAEAVVSGTPEDNLAIAEEDDAEETQPDSITVNGDAEDDFAGEAETGETLPNYFAESGSPEDDAFAFEDSFNEDSEEVSNLEALESADAEDDYFAIDLPYEDE